jgi:hypothetical protein
MLSGTVNFKDLPALAFPARFTIATINFPNILAFLFLSSPDHNYRFAFAQTQRKSLSSPRLLFKTGFSVL